MRRTEGVSRLFRLRFSQCVATVVIILRCQARTVRFQDALLTKVDTNVYHFFRIRRLDNKDWEKALVRAVNRCDSGFNIERATTCSRHYIVIVKIKAVVITLSQ